MSTLVVSGLRRMVRSYFSAISIPVSYTHLQERKPMGQGAGLAGARPGDHPNKAFGRRDRLPLRLIQPLQQILHDTAS